MSIRSIAGAALGLACFGFAPAFAAQPSGEAVKVITAANAQGPGGTRVLQFKGPIFMGDTIETDARGQAQIRFMDDTKLVVGPNSLLTIDRFVFQDQGTAREVTMSAAKGAFRFITGSSRKQAYSIKTPTATIGVRGTRFDFTVELNGTLNLGVWDGEVITCETLGLRRCALITGQCTMVVLAPQQEIQWVQNVYERTDLIARLFPYAFNQSWLLEEWRAGSGACEIHNFAPDYVPNTGNNPPVIETPPPPPDINNF